MATKKIERILVAIHNRDDGEIVLEKAYQIARSTDAKLHVVRVIYEAFAELSIHAVDKSQQLKTLLLQSEEAFLEELIDPLRDALNIESMAIWNKSEYQGILDIAEDCDAQLIIKGAEYPVEGFIRTPTDWNLLRHASVPVMLVKPVAWTRSPVVLAAIDATADDDEILNMNVLARGQQLAEALQGELQVVSVIPSVENWVGPVTLVVDFDYVRRSVGNALGDRISKLVNKAGIDVSKIHTPDGNIDTMIAKTAAESNVQILVLATRHREGARGLFMGNTSEKILHRVRCDVEVSH